MPAPVSCSPCCHWLGHWPGGRNYGKRRRNIRKWKTVCKNARRTPTQFVGHAVPDFRSWQCLRRCVFSICVVSSRGAPTGAPTSAPAVAICCDNNVDTLVGMTNNDCAGEMTTGSWWATHRCHNHQNGDGSPGSWVTHKYSKVSGKSSGRFTFSPGPTFDEHCTQLENAQIASPPPQN
eukprot:gene13024-biopygen7983